MGDDFLSVDEVREMVGLGQIKIPSGSVIVAGSISAAQIAVGSISASKIAPGAWPSPPRAGAAPAPSPELIQRPKRRTRTEVWI